MLFSNIKNKRHFQNTKEKPGDYSWILAFLSGALTMYFTLLFSHVLSSGDYCFLRGDMRTQLAPFIHNFCERILNGESVYYSFSQFLGMDQSFYFAYCGIVSPFTLLFLLFHNADFSMLTSIVVMIKAGLAAMSFHFFLRRSMKIDIFISIIFSTFYALCSFQVACNLNNFVWMDALYILPIIILSIYLISETGNAIPLCLSYTYMFIVQFYMGYMVGIVSFIFFLFGIWFLTHKVTRRRYILSYLSAVLVSILLSAFIWAPTAYYLSHQYAEDVMGFETFFPNPISLYAQLFYSNNVYANTKLPGLYCGNLTVLLFPAYFIFSKKFAKDNKEKILYGAVLFFLLLSCFIPPIYRFMHAFDAPDGWLYRYSFCISFFLCVISAKVMQNLKSVPLPYFIGTLCFNSVIFFIDTLFFKTYDQNWVFFGIGILIWIIWTVLCIILSKYSTTNNASVTVATNTRILLWTISLLVVFFECTSNGYSCFYKVSPGNTMTTNTENKLWNLEQKGISNALSNDDSFYRVNYNSDPIYNSDSYSNYYGISDFSTAENPNIRTALSRLGFATSIRVITDYGSTPATNMLLGVKYIIQGNTLATYPYIEEPILITETNYPLSIGYMVNNQIKKVTLAENAFENNNTLFYSMIGDSGLNADILYHSSESDVSVIENGLSLQKEDDQFSLITNGDPGTATIQFFIPSEVVPDNSVPCLYITNEKSLNRISSMYIVGPNEDMTAYGGRISMSYIRPFDKAENGYIIEIYCNGQETQTFKDYSVAYLDYNALSTIYTNLSANQLELQSFRNGYIKGTVNVPSNEQNVLFTTIPYENGWELKINGKKQNYISLVDNAFLGIEFPEPGKYELELKYTPGWLKEGYILSGTGLLLFILMLIHFSFLKKSNKSV